MGKVITEDDFLRYVRTLEGRLNRLEQAAYNSPIENVRLLDDGTTNAKLNRFASGKLTYYNLPSAAFDTFANVSEGSYEVVLENSGAVKGQKLTVYGDGEESDEFTIIDDGPVLSTPEPTQTILIDRPSLDTGRFGARVSNSNADKFTFDFEGLGRCTFAYDEYGAEWYNVGGCLFMDENDAIISSGVPSSSVWYSGWGGGEFPKFPVVLPGLYNVEVVCNTAAESPGSGAIGTVGVGLSVNNGNISSFSAFYGSFDLASPINSVTAIGSCAMNVLSGAGPPDPLAYYPYVYDTRSFYLDTENMKLYQYDFGPWTQLSGTIPSLYSYPERPDLYFQPRIKVAMAGTGNTWRKTHTSWRVTPLILRDW